MELRNAYQVLEVEMGASREEVREARNVLVRVWHPDRHQDDRTLHGKADAKLKQINAAYDAIEAADFPPRGRFDSDDRDGATRSAPEDHAPQRPNVTQTPFWTPSSPPPQPAAASPQWAPPQSSEPGAPIQSNPPTARSEPISARSVVIAIVSVGLVLTIYAFSQKTKGNEESAYEVNPENNRPIQIEQTNILPVKQETSNSNDLPIASSDRPRDEVHSAELAEPAEQPTGKAGGGLAVNSQNKFFTIGSSLNEVLAVQGTPTSFSEGLVKYGLSSVTVINGKVAAWYIMPTDPLKVRLLPSTSVAKLGFFTVNSTKDEVLAVQGTPTAVTDDTFKYGLSSVVFVDNKVRSWYIIPTDPLKVQLLPVAPTTRVEFYTVGSTVNEVLQVQGTPTAYSNDEFRYGLSSITFRDGRVSTWHIMPTDPLKVRLTASSQ